MSTTLTILDPIAPAGIAGGKHTFQPLETLKGKVVGFIDNSKPNFSRCRMFVKKLFGEASARFT